MEHGQNVATLSTLGKNDVVLLHGPVFFCQQSNGRRPLKVIRAWHIEVHGKMANYPKALLHLSIWGLPQVLGRPGNWEGRRPQVFGYPPC